MCLQNWVILGQTVLKIYNCLTSLRTMTTTTTTPANDPMTIGQNDLASVRSVVEDCFGHGPQYTCLQCLGRLSPLHEHRCSKRVAALLWRQQRQNGVEEIRTTVALPTFTKVADAKNAPKTFELYGTTSTSILK